MPNDQFDDETIDPLDEENDEDTDEPAGESVRGIASDEDDSLFDEDDEDELDDEALDEEDATDEVGSEGGSPGDTAARRTARVGQTQGSEATETWKPLDNEPVADDTRDSGGAPRRRTP